MQTKKFIYYKPELSIVANGAQLIFNDGILVIISLFNKF